MEHLPTCAVGSYQPPTDHSHRWSGWPGAWCLECHAEDPNELCLAGCRCPCHAEFWAEYARQEAEHGLEILPLALKP
jgi:hypothetical protein